MAGSYLTNGVYLPEMSESPWGEQVNNNFVILSNDIDNIKIDYNTKLSGKFDRTSTTTQIINSNANVNGEWNFANTVKGTITYAIHANDADHAILADTATNANHANSADTAHTSDTSAYATSAYSSNYAERCNKAVTADSATKAKCDNDGNDISQTYLKISNYDTQTAITALNALREHIADEEAHTSLQQQNDIKNSFTDVNNRIDAVNDDLTAHKNNTDIHTSRQEKIDIQNNFNYLQSSLDTHANDTDLHLIDGNARTADEFKENKTIELSGDVTGTASSKGNWSISTVLANSGVVSGTYGQSSDISNQKTYQITVPLITVDSKGRITNIENHVVNCEVPDNTDFVDLISNQNIDGIKTFIKPINGDLNGNANTCTEYFLNMVDTAEDLENALNTKPPTLKDVFETWYRFSHTGNTQYNLSNATGQALADLQGWQFDENKMRIANNVNTGTYTGFISNKTYKKYTLGIKVCGPDEEFEQLFGTAGYLKDDDMFGIVCGYMKDDQGNEHTLSFIRDAAATICGLYYDYGKSTSVMLYNALSQVTVVHKGDGESGGTDDGWYMKYAHMEVQRDGSTLNIRGSQINEDNYSISFTYKASDVPDNLAIDTYNNIKNMLLTKSNVGVSLLSQNGFMYLERFDGLFNSNDIYDTLNNVIYAYDSNNNSWYLTNRKVSDEVADYSRIYNENTEKSFVYYDEKSYMTSCNSGNTFNVTTTAGNSNLQWNSEVTLGTVGGLAIKAKLPANPITEGDVIIDGYVTGSGSFDKDGNCHITVTPNISDTPSVWYVGKTNAADKWGDDENGNPWGSTQNHPFATLGYAITQTNIHTFPGNTIQIKVLDGGSYIDSDYRGVVVNCNTYVESAASSRPSFRCSWEISFNSVSSLSLDGIDLRCSIAPSAPINGQTFFRCYGSGRLAFVHGCRMIIDNNNFGTNVWGFIILYDNVELGLDVRDSQPALYLELANAGTTIAGSYCICFSDRSAFSAMAKDSSDPNLVINAPAGTKIVGEAIRVDRSNSVAIYDAANVHDGIRERFLIDWNIADDSELRQVYLHKYAYLGLRKNPAKGRALPGSSVGTIADGADYDQMDA